MKEVHYSVVIPTYNAEKYLLKLSLMLKNLTINHCPPDLVLFLDSTSSDLTKDIVAKDFDVVSIATVNFDHGGTRSLVKDLTEGDVIVYLTQDALPFSVEDIMRLVAVFEDESIGAAYGRQLPYPGTNLFGKHLRTFNYPDKSYIRSFDDTEQFGIQTAFLSNSFAAYRRSAMDKIDWFKNGLILGEDTYAGAKLLQAGYKLAYVADAQVYHSHSYSVWEEFKRYFDIGVFHQMESWILKDFGKPEGEGMRYIKSEFNFLLENRAYYLIPEFFIRNGMKFLGYKLGKHYQKLPKSWVKAFSMHHRWWDKYWSEDIGIK
ncbi:MAG: glycosyltransferase family 2 protein [Shewanella vesiculosa]|uniref:glycosyltransferase n=1 Tax=Shewanella vesiculosa TaxID=518738 RepID=UPI0009199475|nr:glycosyltransferase [Shewanella vesiculosa]NCO14330.1 glycosyltransferase family 2 protein [Thiomicrospira sp.]NCP38808.1 glycosyltransferase family 2 protein [Shewanella vesiculosa]OIP96390.1 MAG: glycosyl transferase [Thiomicrospira sp. CG2_30_44_34]